MTAEVRAVRSLDLRTELPGRVVQVGFAPGAAVTRGQVLLRLDTVEEGTKIAPAEAEARLAELALMGHFPLVLVSGAGAEARKNIGIILVAGMLVGTMFTLFVLPSIYVLLASDHRPNEIADETGLTVEPA